MKLLYYKHIFYQIVSKSNTRGMSLIYLSPHSEYGSRLFTSSCSCNALVCKMGATVVIIPSIASILYGLVVNHFCDSEISIFLQKKID